MTLKLPRNAGFYLSFVAASFLFLTLEHLTHIEFFFHLAAIPLEVMVAVFIVEKLLEKRESKAKRQQLMYIKSYMFRSDMRSLFLANFAGLKTPEITMVKIKNSSLEDLRRMRCQAEVVTYKSPEAMEAIIQEYAKAKAVWLNFMERAITYNFESIFLDMIYIIHFTDDYRAFKDLNPGDLFIHEAEKNEWLMAKVRKVLTDGIQKFLDYAIELKEKQPQVFHDLMIDYEFSSRSLSRQA